MFSPTTLMTCLARFASMSSFSAALLGAAMAASPPIDCRKAKGAADREICGLPEFLAMDREIAALYDRGMTQLTGEGRHRLALSQHAFLHQRTGCDWAAHHSAHPGVAVEECVRTSMEGRVHALRTLVDHGR